MAGETFDACIIGSGAGGGAAALALSRAGLRTLVLEKGPSYREEDFFHDELQVCRRDFFVPSVLDEPRVLVDEKGEARTGQSAWIACCVGGGTVHMSGYFFRMHREDFRLRTAYGSVKGAAVADWPITFDELEPFYEEAERLMTVSGDASKNPFEPRQKPWPLPPLQAHPAAALVENACEKVGLHCFPIPRAIASQPFEGRPACAYCGFCGSYGCEVGAKGSSPVALLAPALKTGNLTVRPRAMVTRIEVDKAGRARAVLYLDEKGATQRIEARVIVLAASAIESARLLLNSADNRNRHGLGNGSGLLGKNLLFAAFSSGFARFPGSSPHFPPAARVLPFIDRAVQDHYLLKAGAPYPKGGTILFQRPHPNPIFQASRLAARPGSSPLFGAALKKQLKEFFVDTNTVEWESFAEFLPHAGCEVAVDPQIKDRFGLPVARLKMGVHPTSLAVSDELSKTARAVMEAAGAQSQGTLPDERVYPVLQAGTARMGHKPSDSVVDPSGQMHEVKNLYVADASTFPSSSGAPFTLTIVANALRVGAGVVERARRGDL